jgi:hypothetical protein
MCEEWKKASLWCSSQCFGIGYSVGLVQAGEEDKGRCPYFYIEYEEGTYEQIEISMNGSYSEKINQFILKHFCALNFLWYKLWNVDDFTNYFKLTDVKKMSVEAALYEICRKEEV